METIPGAGNGIVNYVLVLVIYFLMYFSLNFQGQWQNKQPGAIVSFLQLVWFFLIFSANYFFHSLAVMKFMPWLNNFTHSAKSYWQMPYLVKQPWLQKRPMP